MHRYFVEIPEPPNSFREQGIQTLRETLAGIQGLAFLEHQKLAALRALGWSPDQIRELPTCEVSTTLLRQYRYEEPVIIRGIPRGVFNSWKRHMCFVSNWWQQHPTFSPHSVTLNYTQDSPTPSSLGHYTIWFGTSRPNWRHYDPVWEVAYQHGHLWIGGNCPRPRKEMVRILTTFVPSIMGQKWQSLPPGPSAFRLEDQVSRILRKPYVLAVELQGAQLSVFTRERAVICHYPIGRNSWYFDVGEFQIVFSDFLRLINLSRQISIPAPQTPKTVTKDHPHVIDQLPCLGNYDKPVRAHVQARNYAAALDMLWLYLQKSSHSPDAFPIYTAAGGRSRQSS